MASIKSINLLPEIFRTDANKKFLAATVDQLISEPDFKRVDGFIGRKFAPTYKATDSYLEEPSTDRANYQLEPSFVVQDASKNVNFYSSYIDLLQKIAYYGGLTNDHSRLFENEAYNFNGLFDFDKFVNFNQYYWLPDGPPEVAVSANTDLEVLEINVTRDTKQTSYTFSGASTDPNPILTLIKGNSYKFNVNQAGHQFWIQTDPGKTGTRSVEAEKISREIFGIENNGDDVGTVIFNVPSTNAQDDLRFAERVATVNFATSLPYKQVQSNLLTILRSNGGIDGTFARTLDGCTLIFLNRSEDAEDWTDPGSFDFDRYDQDVPYPFSGYEQGLKLDRTLRYDIFRIRVTSVGATNGLVQLEHIQTVNNGQKVYISGGVQNAGVEYIKSAEGYWNAVVPITSPLTELYYQDSTSDLYSGTIRLIEPNFAGIDVEADIVGRKNYTSPNGVKFTNGMKVRFDSTVSPSFYINNAYIVEGVGRSIRLVSVGSLTAPEEYALADQLATPDYITISRGSSDLNAWSRSNRWFHSQLVDLAAKYNKDPDLLLTTPVRATRPIIEFEPDLYLYEYGQTAKAAVDILDYTVTDALKEVEGKETYVITLPNNTSRQLTSGTRIIFAADKNPEVRNRIYKVDYITTADKTQIHLVSQNTELLPTYQVDATRIIDDTTVVISGGNPDFPASAEITVDSAQGFIQDIVFSNIGVNYRSTPVVSFVGAGAGTGGEIALTLNNGRVENYEIISVGSGYAVAPVYNFIPKVTFSAPVPSLAAVQATGTAIMAPTTVANISVSYNGLNFVADPFIKIDTAFVEEAQIDPFYSAFRYVDHIRITNKGSGVGTVSTATISSPNALEKTSTYANANTFTSNILVVNNTSDLSSGQLIIAPGVSGGTTIQTVINGTTLRLSNPAAIRNSQTYVFKSDTATSTTLRATYSNSAIFSTRLVAFNSVLGLSVGDNIFGEGVPVGTAVENIFGNLVIQFSKITQVQNDRAYIFKPSSAINAVVQTTSRHSNIIAVDSTKVAGVGMYISGGTTPTSITNITTDNPVVITTSVPHNLIDGDVIVIRGVVGTTEINNNTYWVEAIDIFNLRVYADEARQVTLDGRNYGNYVSGGVVAAFTIEYGVTVAALLDENRLLLSAPVSVRAGTTMTFAGKRATARVNTDSNEVYAVVVTDAGSGYTTTPTVTMTYAGATAPTAQIVLNNPVLEYFKVVYPGSGYQISSAINTEIISDVLLSTATETTFGTNTLVFDDIEQVKYIKENWLVFLIVEENLDTSYRDFSRVPYTTAETTGPNIEQYQQYMDVALTTANILKVTGVTEFLNSDNKIQYLVTLNETIDSLDSDGERINLPAGTALLFTAKNRYFTDGNSGNDQPIGQTKSGFIVRQPVNNSFTIPLETVSGIQIGMSVNDVSDSIGAGVRVVSVDVVNQEITTNTRLNVPVGLPLEFTTLTEAEAFLKSTKIQSIQIDNPGAEYTSAPTVTIEPAIPIVQKIGTSTGTNRLLVPDLDGIIIGMTVTSEYNVDGNGVTTGAVVPKVVATETVQTGTATFEFYVVLNQVQPQFDGLLLTFTYATKAISLVTSATETIVDSNDVTPETYEIDDTVIIALPTTGQNAIKQRQIGVNTFNQYYFTGDTWLPAQQKTQYNQAPLFDLFNDSGTSVSDKTVYTGSKFFGTKIFSYKQGTGNKDLQLGFALSYKNFENVGDIQFENNFDTDSFAFIENKFEKTLPLNRFFFKQKTASGHTFRNIWTKVLEPTKQYQAITQFFNGITNYFEIDILPFESETVPYIKVYVDNKLLPETKYQVTNFQQIKVVVIDEDSLSFDPLSKVDILIYSKSVSAIGYYQIPSNIEYNTGNSNFNTLTLGQLRQHLVTMSENSYGLQGSILSRNNLRDLEIKNWAGGILQHAAPAIYAGIALGDDGFEFIESVELAQREYTKFKNKFLDQAIKLQIDIKNIPDSVDRILDVINLGKNTTMSWYDSDMVPYGNAFTKTTIPIIDTRQRRYQIPNLFNDSVPSRRSVLVYLKNSLTGEIVQLVKNFDFTFNKSIAAIDLNENLTLNVNQFLELIDRPSTVGSYIPETPTKLGLYPSYVPQIFVDDTYQVPKQVIQGHDGSITPSFGDFRDALLLELELRIYNNIKTTYTTTIIDIIDSIPGKFRKINYNRDEFNQLITRNFLRWVGVNAVDYSSNTTFQSNNPWTWNYKFLKDIDEEPLPGFWRGIYFYYFDTDKPHVTPWEMLGFYEKPAWWENRYGPAPYTGSNTVLWDDLELGYIAEGDRQGVDARFVRPGLKRFIPVDEFGQLKSPEKFAPVRFDSSRLSAAWAIGDLGPAETAWRKSSEYPFALQMAVALSRPAFYFGTLANAIEYKRDRGVDQLVNTVTKQRINKDNFPIPDDGLVSGTVSLTAGYINWVRDYFTNKAINGTEKIKNLVRNIEVKLSYKMAGYSDGNFLTVVADQSSPVSRASSIILPAENTKIFLNKSAPVEKIVYSAVVVERSASGFSVRGYDLDQPYFTIIPSKVNNNAYSITAIEERAVIYKDFEPVKVVVPYGFEFATKQQVVDFLISYGRYLIAQGFIFDTFNTDLGNKQDWVLSAKEFLTWSQQGWKGGNIIILSPVFNSFKVNNTTGIVDYVANKMTGSRILDQNFNVVKNSQFSVVRDENVFTLTSVFGHTFGLASLNLVQYEHVLLLDNNTVFGDVVYQPELGNRQYRLRLIGNKTNNWTGQLNPGGFIYNSDNINEWQTGRNYKKGTLISFKDKFYYAILDVPASTEFDFTLWSVIDKSKIKTGLLPNFAFNAEKFNNIYNIDDTITDNNFDQLSNGITGFRQRSYFQDFKLDTVSQSKFYQGYIKQKGSINAIDALTTARFENLFSTIELYEEWALRVGDYGALGSDKSIEFQLVEQTLKNNPATLVLINQDENNAESYINVRPTDLYATTEEQFTKTPITTRTDIKPRISDSITAGYPRLDDVDATIFDIRDYAVYDNLVTNIGAGYKIWVAKDFNNSWNVYRANETDVLINQLQVGLDNRITVVCNKPHGLTADTVIVIKNFDSDYNGFYQIQTVTGNETFTVEGYKNLTRLKSQQIIEGVGILLSLISVRFSRINQLVNFIPRHGWRNQDRIWVDNDIAEDVWAVFEKNAGWKFDEILPLREGEAQTNQGYGDTIAISNDQSLLIGGVKNYSSGGVAALRIIWPGFLYQSPQATFSAPDQDKGKTITADLDTESGTLLTTRVTAGGSNYNLLPNVTVVDENTVSITANVYQSNTFVLSTLTTSVTKTPAASIYDRPFITLTNINSVWVGDAVSGSDGTGNVLASVIVANVNYSTNQVTFTSNISWSIINSSTLSFVRRLVHVGDTITGTDNSGNVIASPTTVTAVNAFDNTIETGARTNSFNAGQTLKFSRGTGGNVQARLFSTSIASIEVIDGGSGFVTPPTIELIGGGGTGAKILVNLITTGAGTGSIDSVTILDGGSGYTSPPEINLITTNVNSGAQLLVKLIPSLVENLVIGAKGSGYKTPTLVFSTVPGATGSGATGNVNVTNQSVSEAVLREFGQGYTQDPVLTITDGFGDGVGCELQVVRTTGAVVGFQRNDAVYSQVQNITPFGVDAKEFGAAIDIGVNYAFVGSPGSFNNKGAVLVSKSTGTNWISQQVLYNDDLEVNSRFGHAVVCTDDQSWLYIGTPGVNKVFAYGRKKTPNNQEKIEVLNNQSSYLTQFLFLKTTAELKVVGDSGKIFEPIFDYTLVAGVLTFKNFGVISNEKFLYITQLYPASLIVPTTIRGVLQTNYTLAVTPLEIEQLNVVGATGRIFIYGLDYTITGVTINFLNNEFANEASLVVNVLDFYYVLIKVLEPTDQLIWESGINGNKISRLPIADTLNTYSDMIAGSFSTGDIVKVLNTNGANNGSYQLYRKIAGGAFVLQATENRLVTRGVAKFGWSLAIDNEGYQLVVGAPEASFDTGEEIITKAGKIYIFDREYQIFVGSVSGTNTTYRTLSEIAEITKVTLNGIEQTLGTDYDVGGADQTGVSAIVIIDGGANYTSQPTVTLSGGDGSGAVAEATVDLLTGTVTQITIINSGSGYTSPPVVLISGGGAVGGDVATAYAVIPTQVTVTFVNPPASGAKIKVDVNQFNTIQRLENPDPVKEALFGVSVALAPDRKNIFVGAPGYRDIDYYNGKVYRYVNEPLTFGKIIGENAELSISQGDYIRINDIPVVFQEASSDSSKTIKDINGRQITGIFARNDGVDSVEFLSEVVEGITVSLRGEGYFTNNVAITIDPPDQIQDGITATVGGVTLYANGAINSFTITNRGSGYTFAPNVRITGGNTVPARVITSITNSQIAILSNVDAKSQSINIAPGVGTALDDIGLEIYNLSQEFQHPELGVPEKFGKLVKVDNVTGSTLLISSEGGVTLKNSTFDDLTTVFDKDTTRFIDVLKNAGAVYVYDYLPIPAETKSDPSRYLYNQVLQNSKILLNDNFGSGIDIRDNLITVGANKSDFYNSDAGLIHLFLNSENKKGWSKLRTRSDKVDIDYVNQAFLYSRQTQLIKTDLDYYDPAKGKILGVADQDLDYKTVYDPAVYNQGNRKGVTFDENSVWNDIHVGNTWWNLDVCRYIDYEQGDLNYRVTYWGELFPGSEIEVCEWVESFALPSQYAAQVGDGEAKYPDDSAYVEFNFLDNQSGLIRTKFYYWVKNKSQVDTVNTRRLSSVSALSNIIENPRGQNIPYFAVVAPNAFNLYNINEFIVADETIFKLEYAISLNENIAHSEYELIEQSNPNSIIPEKYIEKLIDSLAGENSTGEVVPDLRLKENIQLGVSLRPRQTMIKNSAKAIEVFVKFVNRFLTENLIVRYKNISGLTAAEPIPPDAAGFYNQVVDNLEQLNFIQTAELITGYKVLVLSDSDYEGFWTIYEYDAEEDSVWTLDRIQSYDSNRYWKYADWYAPGYDSQTQIDYIVQQLQDIVTLPLVEGDLVKVLDDGNGNFEIYYINADLALVIVGVQNGTIELDESLYNADLSFTGFDNAPFDNVGFSKTAAIEMRNIIRGLIDGVFTGTDRLQINNTFFVLINYILSEQRSLDWLIKTSLLSVVHRIRKLEQFSTYIRDQQDYFESYINEVKPYRTQIRNYLLDYEGTDFLNSRVMDFDLPSIYDFASRRYRTLNINNSIDANIIAATQGVDWSLNYKYRIESIQVVNGGSGFFRAPTVVITGGGGSGASAVASIDFTTGQVIEIDITNPGVGYTSRPDVAFVGGGGYGAKAYVVLSSIGGNVTSTTLNKTVRSFKTNLSFDRITYNSQVYIWKPYKAYHAGDILVVPDVTSVLFNNLQDQFIPRYNFAYRVLKTILTGETVNLNLFNDPTVVQKLSGKDIDNAIDRVAVYNQPGSPDIAVLYSSPDSVRLDASNTNEQASSQANEWNKISHSLIIPYSHQYQFLAVGNRALIAVSQTGETWTTIPLSEDQVNLRDAVFFAGNTWVAVGNQATLLRSDDAFTWTKEQVTEFKFSPTADSPNGLTQINANQVVDFVGVTAAKTTRSDYVIAVGNGSTILVNPYNTSADIDQGWYSAKPQPLIYPLPEQFITVAAVSFGDLTDINGTKYSVSFENSGFFTNKNRILGSWNALANVPALTNGAGQDYLDGDLYEVIVAGSTNFGAGAISFSVGNYVVWNAANNRWQKLSSTPEFDTMQQGFIIAAGVNGHMFITSFNRLDDLMQGFSKTYNYDSGKLTNQNYPWIPLLVPNEVRGLGDGVSGEQITSVAVSTSFDRWIVAIGSGGTLIWNRLDSPIEIQIGTADLASDTINKTVVDYGIRTFQNFRYFDADNFSFPLTLDAIKDTDFTEVRWDNEKFVVTGSSSTTLWGYPGAKSEAYVELGNINPVLDAQSRAGSSSGALARWSSVASATSVTVEIDGSALIGWIIPGMTVTSTHLPTDSVVSAASYNSSTDVWTLTVTFASTSFSSRTGQQISFAYGFTSDISAGTVLTFNGPNGQTKTLTTSRAAAKGARIVYVTNYDQIANNWTISGTGIPTGARIKQIGRFAKFTWQYAQGSGRNQLIDYNTLAINTTTIQLNQSFTEDISAGSTITFFDSTGTKSQAVVTQNLRKDISTMTFGNTIPIGTGFRLEANAQLGIASNTIVTGTRIYAIGGVLNHLAKDIPDLIPGTSYNGVKVLGQAFTDTSTDITSLDTSISSEFVDSALGTRPEDIIINGGKFIDTYSSHAPEELVPGQIIDSLQMNVFTANVTNGNIDYGNVIAYKIFTDYKLPTVYYRLAAANTTVLSANLSYDDTEIIVEDISKLPEPNAIQNQPGSIWVNGERINYFGIDIGRNAITDIRRGASRTSIPVVHVAGSLASDASADQEIIKDTVLTITSDYAVNNGFAGDANTSIYRSAVVTSVPQGQIWLNLGT